MRSFTSLLLAAAFVSLVASGCNRGIPRSELGQVVFEVPKIGDDKPVPLPQLEGVIDVPEHGDEH